MAKKKIDLQKMDDAELLAALDETKEDLFNMRFQVVTGQLSNYANLTETKRQVARIKTEIRKREIAAAEAVEA